MLVLKSFCLCVFYLVGWVGFFLFVIVWWGFFGCFFWWGFWVGFFWGGLVFVVVVICLFVCCLFVCLFLIYI